jgi:hypothetical protein
VRAELPTVGELGEPEQVLVSAWLTGLRSARIRRAYAGMWRPGSAGSPAGALSHGEVEQLLTRQDISLRERTLWRVL